MYTVTCDCGNNTGVASANAGSDVTCPRCQKTIPVPSLSQLKTEAGESLLSITDGIVEAIAKRDPPFDGVCQVCTDARATKHLRASIRYLVERILTGSEFSASSSGIGIGYAPADEYWNVLDVPCLFCERCADEFRRSWRRASVASSISKLLKMVWLVPLAIIAIVLIALLPFVGLTAAAFIVYVVYRNMTRKKADAFLLGHLRTIDAVSKLLDEQDEYLVKCSGFSSVTESVFPEIPNDRTIG
jgi:hypothetical protein